MTPGEAGSHSWFLSLMPSSLGTGSGSGQPPKVLHVAWAISVGTGAAGR